MSDDRNDLPPDRPNAAEVLALLEQGESIRATGAHGPIVSTARWLVRKGWAALTMSRVVGRKVYRITDEGRAELTRRRKLAAAPRRGLSEFDVDEPAEAPAVDSLEPPGACKHPPHEIVHVRMQGRETTLAACLCGQVQAVPASPWREPTPDEHRQIVAHARGLRACSVCGLRNERYDGTYYDPPLCLVCWKLVCWKAEAEMQARDTDGKARAYARAAEENAKTCGWCTCETPTRLDHRATLCSTCERVIRRPSPALGFSPKVGREIANAMGPARWPKPADPVDVLRSSMVDPFACVCSADALVDGRPHFDGGLPPALKALCDEGLVRLELNDERIPSLAARLTGKGALELAALLGEVPAAPASGEVLDVDEGGPLADPLAEAERRAVRDLDNAATNVATSAAGLELASELSRANRDGGVDELVAVTRESWDELQADLKAWKNATEAFLEALNARQAAEPKGEAPRG